MGECKVTVDAGACKMKTIIVAKENEMGMVEFTIESDCSKIIKMSWGMEPVSPYSEIEAPMNQTEVYKWASENIPHAACPVPCAMIKAMEVASGLGIKRNVNMEIE